jgi:uncharacterized protein with GYD domain
MHHSRASKEPADMAHYIVLTNWTEQGARNAKDTLQRADQARQAFEALGGRLEAVYWTMGAYDSVSIVEAPDDESATAAVVKIASGGNVKTQTLRAFSADEVAAIMQKAG